MTARDAPRTGDCSAPIRDGDCAPYQLVLSRGLPDEAGAIRLRSLVGRVLARRLLGQRLGLAPGAVPLDTGPHGKPMPAVPTPAWHFNIAHSGDLVLVGAGPQPLGVDVEHCPDTVDANLWRLVTGRADTAPDPGTFCAHWVRREAVLKACGLGLRAEPGTLRLSEPDDGGWTPVAGRPEVEGLQVRLLQATPDHCAALCLTNTPAPGAWTLKTLALADWA